MSEFKGIVAHWTAGGYNAGTKDKKHYHRLWKGDGTLILGDHKPEANLGSMKPGTYAAHTLNANSGRIGHSMCCMRGAKKNVTHGPSPMTETQFEAMCKGMANDCKKYGIPVSPRTVLSHAEVQGTLKIKQRGKWDFTVLPFMPELKGARQCGDYMRKRVNHYLAQMGGVRDDEMPGANARIRWLQKLLNELGYDCGTPDGYMGDLTEAALELYQRAVNLPVTKEFDSATVLAIRSGKGKKTTTKEIVVEKPVNNKTALTAAGAIGIIITIVADYFGLDVSAFMSLIN